MAAHPVLILSKYACNLLALAALGLSGEAMAQTCEGPRFEGGAMQTEDSRAICRAAERARDFLARCGIHQQQEITVRVTDRLDRLHHPYAIASYDAQRQEMILLDRGRAIAQLPAGSPYRRLSAEDVHAGLVAHELAHAIVLQQAGAEALSRTAHEYIASVVQLASLQPAARDKLLQAFPQRGPVETAALNGFTFQVAPQRFTINAYRHFTAAPDACVRLRAVMDGSLHFVDNPE